MRPIDSLDDTIKDLTAYMASLAPDQLETSKTNKWGAREVFIHIVFWHEQYASITKDLLRNGKPLLLTGSHVDINAFAVEQNIDVPIEVLIDRLHKAQADLSPLYDSAINLRIAFKEGWKARAYPDAIELIEQHILSHLARLKKRYH